MTTLLDRIESRLNNGRITRTAPRRLNGSAPRWPLAGSSSPGSGPRNHSPPSRRPGRRDLRRRGPVPLRRQEAARYQAQRVPGRDLDPDQDHRLLAWLTLPFPEPGVRLLKHDQVEAFDQQMADYKAELDDAVKTLDRRFDELKQAAAQRLGSLYNPADYPATLVGLFGVSWDYPNIEPPDYLIGLSPDLYRQEQERVRARFEEAVQLAEQAFLDEFAKVVADLTERITGTNEDGTPKVFRDSAIDNLFVLRAIPLFECPQQPAA